MFRFFRNIPKLECFDSFGCFGSTKKEPKNRKEGERREKGEGKEKGKERKRKGKGRERKGKEREGKGKGKGREREREEEGKGKGKGREREGEGHFVNFCSFSSFRIGFEIPKQTERSDYILSEKIPKQNRNCQCFGLFRFEPKEKKSVSQDTLSPRSEIFIVIYVVSKFMVKHIDLLSKQRDI